MNHFLTCYTAKTYWRHISCSKRCDEAATCLINYWNITKQKDTFPVFLTMIPLSMTEQTRTTTPSQKHFIFEGVLAEGQETARGREKKIREMPTQSSSGRGIVRWERGLNHWSQAATRMRTKGTKIFIKTCSELVVWERNREEEGRRRGRALLGVMRGG